MKRASVGLLAFLLGAGLMLVIKVDINWPWARTHHITVGPLPSDISESKAKISKKERHWIVWQSNAGQKLGIVIRVPLGDPAPFNGLTEVGKDDKVRFMAVPCSEDTCFSGRARSDAKESADGYKYDQILDGQKADGWIIIEK